QAPPKSPCAPTVRGARAVRSGFPRRSCSLLQARNEEVGNAGRAHIAQSGQPVAWHVVIEQHRAAEYRTLAEGLQRARRGQVVVADDELRETFTDLLGGGIQHDAALLDEDHVSEQM